MTVRIESPQVNIDSKLNEHVTKKITKLGQYYDRIIDADVTMKLENAGQVKDKIVEVKLHVPGDTLFVKCVDKTFEASADEAFDRLKRSLIKFKELQRSHR